MIKGNSKVEIHYIGKTKSDGKVFDSSYDRNQTFTFNLGNDEVVKGLEDVLIDKNKGDKFTTDIPFDKAYGEYVENQVEHIPLEQLPKDVDKNKYISALDENQQQIVYKIKDINEQFAVIDLNHPLAGEDLVFDVEVINVI